MDRVVLGIAGMHCASCAVNIAKFLEKRDGVVTVNVNFVSEKAYIEYDAQKISPKDPPPIFA